MPAALRRTRRWLDNFWVRNALGLVVLAAIVGGLVAIDRTRGEELGPLDSRRPKVGEAAPEFALRDLDGRVRTLSDYRGRVVWLNFWATWCGPCRQELPEIQRLADEFGKDGLVVLEINEQESGADAQSFFDELGLHLPVLRDTDGAVGDQYRRIGLPNSFFIDKAGVLRASSLGFLTKSEMRESLAKAGIEGALLNGQ